jgi:hypothetical protein
MGSEHRQTKCLGIGDERSVGAKYYSLCRYVNYCVGKGAEAILPPIPLLLKISVTTIGGILPIQLRYEYIVLDCQVKVIFPPFGTEVSNVLKTNCSAPQKATLYHYNGTLGNDLFKKGSAT